MSTYWNLFKLPEGCRTQKNILTATYSGDEPVLWVFNDSCLWLIVRFLLDSARPLHWPHPYRVWSAGVATQWRLLQPQAANYHQFYTCNIVSPAQQWERSFSIYRAQCCFFELEQRILLGLQLKWISFWEYWDR